MGYGLPFLGHVVELKKLGLIDDYRNVIEIGAQQISDPVILSQLLDEAVALFGGVKPSLQTVGAPRIRPSSPPGKLLWSAFNLFSKSLDTNGGDLRIDLNKGRVPLRYRHAFDLAINAGTTEHVANQGHAFACIHQLVRAGGMMIHQLPLSGHSNHGFFAYQPKWFHRLAQTNDYTLAKMDIIEERSEIFVAAIKNTSGTFAMPLDA